MTNTTLLYKGQGAVLIDMLERSLTREQTTVQRLYEGARYASEHYKSVTEWHLYQEEAARHSAKLREDLFLLIGWKRI